MRIPLIPEMEEPPPPPYTPQDPSTSANVPAPPNQTDVFIQTTLRGGYMRPNLPSTVSQDSNLSSAATYFEERPFSSAPALHDAGVNLNEIEHDILFDAETTRDSLVYPRPAQTFLDRDVTPSDWATFVNYLFPMDHDLSDKDTKASGETRHAFFAEDTPMRRERVKAVVAEWNTGFFSPRCVRINANFESGSMLSQHLSGPSQAPIPYDPSPVERGINNTNVAPESPDHLFLPYRKGPTAKPNLRRSVSRSSSSSSSSSDSSVDSISSNDLEGRDINDVRAALTAFRRDTSKKDHLRLSVRQLREEFRSQRRDISFKDRRDSKKEYKEQRKELKREVKAVIREVKAAKKAEKKLGRAERRNRRDGHRAERRFSQRGRDALKRNPRESFRIQERVGEQSAREYVRAQTSQSREREAFARAQDRTVYGQTTGYELTAREAAREAGSRSQEAAADAQARGLDSRSAGRERARTAEGKAYENQDWGREGKERARQAEQKAQAKATNAESRDWESEGRQEARQAELRASVAGGNAGSREWRRGGRERAGEAEQRAQKTARSTQNGGWGDDAVNRAQTTARAAQSRN